jgi:hypothetical protein
MLVVSIKCDCGKAYAKSYCASRWSSPYPNMSAVFLLIRHELSMNPFGLSLSKPFDQAQGERIVIPL